VEKLPPFSEELESKVIGCVLIDPHCFELADFLRSDDFYLTPNRLIWEAMLSNHSVGLDNDMTSVAARLETSGRLAAMGGRAMLIQKMSEVATSANVEKWALQVKRKGDARRVIAASRKSAEIVLNGEDELDRSISEATSEFLGAVDRSLPSRPHTAVELAEAHDRLMSSPREPTVRTGFKAVDAVFQGYRPGEFSVVAARPGVGKTNYCLSLLKNFCRDGRKCLFLSLEMSVEELMDRLTASVSGVPTTASRDGAVASQEEGSKRSLALGEISEWKLLVDDSALLTPDLLRSKCRRAKTELGGLDFVFVDYLGLMDVPGRGDRWEKVGAVTRSIKVLAKELRFSAVVAHQINREADKSRDGRPRLHQLRESGNVEQDSDHVFLLYRRAADPNVKIEDMLIDDAFKAEVLIGKNRHGPTGSALLRFDGPRGRFVDWDFK